MATSRRSTISRVLVVVGLLAALVVLAWHIRVYSFLCDDAFISFRYARNFAQGHGLVFNPGAERVEGYSNFLWVLLMAGLFRVGVLPEWGAPLLSIAATLALWGWVARAGWSPLGRGLAWTALVAPWLLATNRSFAVWATSGLETRLFELFIVVGALRLAAETEARLDGRPTRSIAPWWFALASLTRPDGLLFSAMAFAAAAAMLAWRRRLDVVRHVRAWLPYMLLVGGHFAFRRWYYGVWLPNTYYAKVGGRFWWDAGFDYLQAFALEYAAWAWLPLVLIGAWACVRRGRPVFVVLTAALVIPHALYVVAIGGDHFEYRPFDLYLPLLFLLAAGGVDHVARGSMPERRPGRPVAATAVALLWVIATIALAAELPWQSHVQCPSRYLPGFPGGVTSEPERRSFLAPERDPLYRSPGLRAIAARHLALLRRLSVHFVGVRQEEHARFLATMVPEGRRLRVLVEQGRLPADTYIATGAVGALPYYSDLRTLDRLGLTDSTVARSAAQSERVMAHDRSATIEYGRARGVDLWAAHDVHFLWPVTSPQPLVLGLRQFPFHAAEVAPDTFLLALLPQGLDRASARFPALSFVDGALPDFLNRYAARGLAALGDSVRAHPGDDALHREFATFLFLDGDLEPALAEYLRVLARQPEDCEALLNLNICRAMLGRTEDARAGFVHAIAIARARGNEPFALRMERYLEQLPPR